MLNRAKDAGLQQGQGSRRGVSMSIKFFASKAAEPNAAKSSQTKKLVES